jgi:hypothetical protein
MCLDFFPDGGIFFLWNALQSLCQDEEILLPSHVLQIFISWSLKATWSSFFKFWFPLYSTKTFCTEMLNNLLNNFVYNFVLLFLSVSYGCNFWCLSSTPHICCTL